VFPGDLQRLHFLFKSWKPEITQQATEPTAPELNQLKA
jgi:hypothetical protein